MSIIRTAAGIAVKGAIGRDSEALSLAVAAAICAGTCAGTVDSIALFFSYLLSPLGPARALVRCSVHRQDIMDVES